MVMICDGITQDSMSRSKVDTCSVSSMRVKANSALCVQCGKWIHGRCARVTKVTIRRSIKNYMQKMLWKYWRGSGAGRNVM